MTPRTIYADHNSTTPLHPEVKTAMKEALDQFGNASSLHHIGRHGKNLVKNAREQIASFIGAEPDEIVFVGSGTEANNTVFSIVDDCKNCDSARLSGSHIVTSTIEHPCILESVKCRENRGTQVSYIGVGTDCKIDLENLKKSVSRNTALVSIMMVNNETGTIQNISEMVKIAHACGALFHTDAIQAVGKIPINVKTLDVDFMSISGHKFYGPKGIGVLYIKRGVPFCPLILGGHQENNRRAGTENTLGMVGLAKAVEMRKLEMESDSAKLLHLKNILKKGITESIPHVFFNGNQDDCVAHVLNVSFKGAEGEAILLYLDLDGIAVSTGSACASGSLDPSHVLLAMGLDVELAHGSIRISLGRDNTEQDMLDMVASLKKNIAKIRQMSSIAM